MILELEQLVRAFSKLPSIGRRSAERMALRLVGRDDALVSDLVTALENVREHVCLCSRCGAITVRTADPCSYCTDPRRDDRVLCVVEEAGDLLMIEQSAEFRGRYHVLGGRLSPRRREGLKTLRIDALVRRLVEEKFEEVILATDSDVEGDATAAYLQELLADKRVRVSRLALGLPAGSGIAYSDPVTLSRAIKGRQPVT